MPNRLRVPARAVLSGLALAALASHPVSAQRREYRDWSLSCRQVWGDDEHQRFCRVNESTMRMSGVLSVDGRMNGGVAVIGEDRRDVLVRAMVETHARTRSRAEDLAGEIKVVTENGRIHAEGPETRSREWWSVSFEVHVPATADLDLKANNGGIAVSGVTGRLRMETLNGGIHLEGVNGDVIAETTNGGVAVDLDGEQWEGRGLEATTTNGGVKLSVPRGYSAHLETGTVNGGVDIDFPVTVQGRIGRRITTDLGKGGATVRVMTTNGGVVVRRG